MANYHTSLRTLPVFNFYEILFNDDLSMLCIGEKSEEDLSEVWQKIKDEFYQKAKVGNRDLKRVAEIYEKKKKCRNIYLLLQLLVNDPFQEVRREVKKTLAKYGYVFDPQKSFDDELERMLRSVKVLETKITIEEDKLPKGMSKKPDLIKEALALENILPNLGKIDIYSESMERWLAIKEMAEERIKARKHNE